MSNIDLKKICTSKILWTAVTAGFAFTIIMFNISMNANAVNAEEIQIVREDIKQVLSDTGYIKGLLENNKGN